MSSPSESITDIDESGSNRKRERAQSVEPTQTEVLTEQTKEVPDISAPKKTKRDEDDNATTSVNTIRKNMKDMTTKDNASIHSLQEDDNVEENVLAKFGGKKDDNEDDWGEFAEEEEPEEKKEEKEKPKYTFGATSGFGTKGWAAAHQTIPKTTVKPTFGGFSSSSGFGAFKTTTSSTTQLTATATTATTTTTTTATTASSFGGFSKATSSPFAAINSTNALSSSTSPETDESDTEKEITNDKNSGSFGEGAKLKVPNIKQQTTVQTGEEDEDTIYQTKAKLLVLDPTSGNWKERGVGTFRINMKQDEKARLVMRTDSVYRLILNISLFEGMKVVIMQEKFVRFTGFEAETKQDGTVENKLVSFALKLSNPTVAKEVCQQINDCIPSAP